MFRRIFGFGKNRKARKQQENEGSLLIKDFQSETGDNSPANTQVVVLRSPDVEAALKKKKDSAELFSDAVNKLVEKLEGINTSLDLQVHHNQQLVEKMDRLPELLSSLPGNAERQEKIFTELTEQMRQKTRQDERSVEALSGIHEKVTACAEIEGKISDHFVDLGRSLTKLDENTVSQTDWIQHLNRSYTSSEQYLRDALTKQQKRFYWLFGLSLAVSVLTLTALAVAVIMLLSR